MTFGESMRALMAERVISLRELAKSIPADVGHLSRISRDLEPPSAPMAERIDAALGADGALAELRVPEPGEPLRGRFVHAGTRDMTVRGHGDEIEALELARRAAASDVGGETLERAVDDLAVAYPRTPPAELLGQVRRHLAYVAGLLDRRKTLAEHQRLLVAGGWLSLLGATCHVDLRQRGAAMARLRTAKGLADETGHAEIAAWCLETEAWQALTDGDHRRAVTLSQGAQAVAPAGGSARVQASAQEGRAWARLGAAPETRRQLDLVASLTANMATPDRPEHHYRYDPAKADAYTATTLAWLGDPAAEPYARQVLARLESPNSGRVRARRVATARLDLSLALVAAGRPDEAAYETLTAVTSGVLVPSNHWRAREVVDAVAAARVPAAYELREAYRELCGTERGPVSG
ncbi:hypothetical protein [Actinoallomurus iriomotensis]|uniref:Uncharacterized protein n=1 Tax=Actinoallomurus iriomotensis TaxID=478107 RepID=A0A9W6SAA0_9ACTN|nr:hypothetical protein [Actinoallomurus iriomotensis]GLY88645.1 hypothetical protein Airi02_065740 [Actinoallomurus iriomotensis]